MVLRTHTMEPPGAKSLPGQNPYATPCSPLTPKHQVFHILPWPTKNTCRNQVLSELICYRYGTESWLITMSWCLMITHKITEESWRSVFSVVHGLHIAPMQELDLLIRWLGPRSSNWPSGCKKCLSLFACPCSAFINKAIKKCSYPDFICILGW